MRCSDRGRVAARPPLDTSGIPRQSRALPSAFRPRPRKRRIAVPEGRFRSLRSRDGPKPHRDLDPGSKRSRMRRFHRIDNLLRYDPSHARLLLVGQEHIGQRRRGAGGKGGTGSQSASARRPDPSAILPIMSRRFPDRRRTIQLSCGLPRGSQAGRRFCPQCRSNPPCRRHFRDPVAGQRLSGRPVPHRSQTRALELRSGAEHTNSIRMRPREPSGFWRS